MSMFVQLASGAPEAQESRFATFFQTDLGRGCSADPRDKPRAPAGCPPLAERLPGSLRPSEKRIRFDGGFEDRRNPREIVAKLHRLVRLLL